MLPSDVANTDEHLTTANDDPLRYGEGDLEQMPPKRRGRPKRSLGSEGKRQRSLDAFVKSGLDTLAILTPDSTLSPAPHSSEGLEDSNVDRRKRRKPSTEPDQHGQEGLDGKKASTSGIVDHISADCIHQLPQTEQIAPPVVHCDTEVDTNEASREVHTDRLQNGIRPPTSSAAESHGCTSTLPAEPSAGATSSLTRRMLRINADGTFATPEVKVGMDPMDIGVSKPKRNRKKKACLVVVKYLQTSSERGLGARIDRILHGHERLEKKTVSSTQQTANKPNVASKSMHPFFREPAAKKLDSTGKPESAGQDEAAERRPPRSSAVTPGKLRAEAMLHRTSIRQPDFGNISFGQRTGLTKHPGMKDAPWPTFENVHVRAISTANLSDTSRRDEVIVKTPDERKGKGNILTVPRSEDILCRYLDNLNAYNYASQKPSGHRTELRKPERIVTTGPQIQDSVKTQLRSTLATGPNDESRTSRILNGLYQRIEEHLTPFDVGKCETKDWAQKYAPKRSADVLHIGAEIDILRDWLQKSTTNAVHMGGNRSTTSGKSGTGNPVPSRPERPKKKRKKVGELADFIISSDEEDAQLEEFQELVHSSSLKKKNKWGNTIVRGGARVLKQPPGSQKTSNVVLLSGQHGCGKTAAIYATAQELGFEVFEINSGTKRSGKDILERIGDMTENHLVQRVSQMLAGPKSTKDAAPEVEKPKSSEIDTRQKGLSSFFSTAVAKKPATQSVPNTSKQSKKPEQQRPLKEQKQSVILLEEVDVLFEEDRQFWMTVITIAAHSKRPIILTCNDESLVPLDALTLHAILRLSPPPVALAVDYLLLMAANEGHILERDAVKSLYEASGCDLRASITQLNFWCQMGVGDEKGGLEWIYQRWPPGKDIDVDGNILRVASKGTYHTCMGGYNRDLSLCGDTSPDPGFDLLLDGRAAWSIRRDDLRCPPSTPKHESTQKPNLVALEEVALLSESLSAADVYCQLDTLAVQKVSLLTRLRLCTNAII